MNKQKEDIPCIFYYYLHSKLAEATEDGTMTVKEAEWRMFQWKIPSILRPLILKELERLNLLIKENKNNIKLLKSNFNIENVNKYYFDLGLVTE